MKKLIMSCVKQYIIMVVYTVYIYDSIFFRGIY